MKGSGFISWPLELSFAFGHHKTNILDKPLAMKLIVLSLLLGGIASANGGTCKAKKLREGLLLVNGAGLVSQAAGHNLSL